MTPDQAVVPVRFTEHANQRYRERLRPTLTRAAADRELSAMAATGMLDREPPTWCPWQRDTTGYLVLADVVFPLVRAGSGGDELVATTCLVKTPPSAFKRMRSRR